MKKLDLNGSVNLEQMQGTEEWYWSMDITNGDLYEAQELFQDGKTEGNHFYLIHYPDATIYPVPFKKGCYFGKPIYDNGIILLMVDFIENLISIFHFYPISFKWETIVQIPLCSIENCYNLQLRISPLTLIRQDNDFEIVWPEQVKFPIGTRESFCFRKEDKLYFSVWYEDPEYKEESIVRLLPKGSISQKFSGNVWLMPNGEIWNLKGERP